ncbi:MAG: PEP/pyruvate-binding domain-containing protein [Gammaproteobacteria bacterium]|nr:PEP/pyruvate-binding domain-containing protein [Gammaproteobacteria bacterium]
MPNQALLIRISDNAQRFGNKAANLIELKQFCHQLQLDITVDIPAICPINHSEIQTFLDTNVPSWHEVWASYKEAQNDNKDHLTLAAIAHLQALQKIIQTAFSQHLFSSAEIIQYLDEMKDIKDISLMVRSSGHEDTAEVTNPGGNDSVSAVPCEAKAVSKAIGVVVASYFSEKSLKQRLLSQASDITGQAFMPVLLQRMIGESIHELTPAHDLIRSGVMYTHTYNTKIQMAPGHGELIVNSKGAFDTFTVTRENILYPEIAHKLWRLAPSENPDTRERKLISKKNSKALQNNASISPHVAKQIANLGRMIERHYDEPMDVEFVFYPLSNTVYLVQARPLSAIKLILIPSSIPPKKMSFVRKKMDSGEVKCRTGLISGSSINTAQVITRPEHVLVFDRIGDALRRYLSQSNSLVKAVIVKDIPPDASHEVAQMSAKSIPVLQLDDIEEVNTWLNERNFVLILDPQRNQLINWSHQIDNSSDAEKVLYAEGILKEGLFAQPVRPITAFPLFTRHSRFFNMEPAEIMRLLHKKITSGNHFKLGKNHLFSQMLTCIRILEESQAAGDEVTKALNTIRQIVFKVAQSYHLKTHQPLPILAHVMLVCEEIEKAFEFKYPAVEKLNLIAKLHSFIIYKGNKTIYSNSLRQSYQDYRAVRRVLDIAGAERLSSIQLEYFSEFNKLEKLALSSVTSQAWTKFVLRVCEDFKATQTLASLIEFNTHNQIESDWLNGSFIYFASAKNHVQDILIELTEENKKVKSELEKLKLEEKNQCIERWENKINEWASPAKFEQLFVEYQKEIGDLIASIEWQVEEPLSLNAALKMIQRLTEMMDKTIKSLKGSPEYSGGLVLMQVDRFSQLLDLYLQLMDNCMRRVPDKLYNQLSERIPEKRFNDKINMLKAIGDTYRKCLTKKSAAQLNASGYLSIDSARLGSTASFARQFVEKSDMVTLEDLFSLMHQNIIASTVYLSKDIQVSRQDLPDTIRPLLDAINNEERRGRIQLLSIQHHYPKVRVDFNVPLQNHSLQFSIEYDQLSQATLLRGRVFGKNWSNRMSLLCYMLTFEGQLFNCRVRELPQYLIYADSVSFAWEFSATQLKDEAKDIVKCLLYIRPMTNYSQGDHDADAMTDIAHHTKAIVENHNNVLKMLDIYLRSSSSELTELQRLDKAFVNSFIIGASQPETSSVCMAILQTFPDEFFTSDFSDFENILWSLKEKEDVNILLKYYLERGVNYDPFDSRYIYKLELYPELTAYTLRLIEKNPQVYRIRFSGIDAQIVLLNNSIVIQKILAVLIDKKILVLSDETFSHLPLPTIYKCYSNPVFKQKFREYLTNSSLAVKQDFMSKLLNSNFGYQYGDNVAEDAIQDILNILITEPHVLAFLIEQLKSKTITQQEISAILSTRHHLLIVECLSRTGLDVLSMPDWKKIFNDPELRQFIIKSKELKLKTTSVFYFQKELFDNLLALLDRELIIPRLEQLIALLKNTNIQKVMQVLRHPNFRFQKQDFLDKAHADNQAQQQRGTVGRPFRGDIFSQPSGSAANEQKVIDTLWVSVDAVNADYEVREYLFKAGWRPKSTDLSYIDYLKYEYDSQKAAPIPRLNDAIRVGDIDSIKYYLQHDLPESIKSNIVLAALAANQYFLVLFLLKETDVPILKTEQFYETLSLCDDVEVWKAYLNREDVLFIPSFVAVMTQRNDNDNPMLANYFNFKISTGRHEKIYFNLLEKKRFDIILLLLQSQKFAWPISFIEQRKMLAALRATNEPKLTDFVDQRLKSLSSEDDVFDFNSKEKIHVLSALAEVSAPVEYANPALCVDLIYRIYHYAVKPGSVEETLLDKIKLQSLPISDVSRVSVRAYKDLFNIYQIFCQNKSVIDAASDLFFTPESVSKHENLASQKSKINSILKSKTFSSDDFDEIKSIINSIDIQRQLPKPS